jgi:outer membrane protein assembly factor BamD (BamD/ComL family)
LLPSGAYEYEPEYCGSGQSGGPVFSSAQLLYDSAKVNIQNNNYTEAESQLKQIVTDYPETEVAKTSLKELYVLEELADSNYTVLKNYYNTEPNLQNNDELSKLAGWLANYCDVKIENYQDAINWYENVIDTSNRNTNYIGKYPEHKPVSKEKYVLKRDELINLLFKNSEASKTNEFDTELSDSKIITLYQNYPNPFNKSCKIEFYLAEESQVKIELYNLLGEKIQTITDKYYTKGKHEILLNSDRLKTGVYYCTVKLNGALVEGKKMMKIE